MISFSFVRSACVLNYHSLSIGTNSLGWNRYMASFLSASAELPAQLFVFFGLKYVGGRTSFVIMTSLSGISLLTSLPFLRCKLSTDEKVLNWEVILHTRLNYKI